MRCGQAVPSQRGPSAAAGPLRRPRLRASVPLMRRRAQHRKGRRDRRGGLARKRFVDTALPVQRRPRKRCARRSRAAMARRAQWMAAHVASRSTPTERQLQRIVGDALAQLTQALPGVVQCSRVADGRVAPLPRHASAPRFQVSPTSRTVSRAPPAARPSDAFRCWYASAGDGTASPGRLPMASGPGSPRFGGHGTLLFVQRKWTGSDHGPAHESTLICLRRPPVAAGDVVFHQSDELGDACSLAESALDAVSMNTGGGAPPVPGRKYRRLACLTCWPVHHAAHHGEGEVLHAGIFLAPFGMRARICPPVDWCQFPEESRGGRARSRAGG